MSADVVWYLSGLIVAGCLAVCVIVELIQNAGIRLVFAWYDFWIGAYYDRKSGWLYLLPVPCVGIAIRLREIEREV